jgi:hypothetical protein
MSASGRSWRKRPTVVLETSFRRRVLSQKPGRKQNFTRGSFQPVKAQSKRCLDQTEHKDFLALGAHHKIANSMPFSEYDVIVPHHLVSLPPIHDTLETESSKIQDETAKECLALLVEGLASRPFESNTEIYTTPNLQRQKHIAFLHGSLGHLPAGFVAADASRPWMLYWALSGLHLLGEDISHYRERYEYP